MPVPAPRDGALKAVVYAGPGAVRVDDVDEPSLTDGDDAIVQVTLTSICGSDMHLLEGKVAGMREGGIIGHEYVGVIRELGDRATKHHEDTRVLGSFLIACGDCEACSRGRFNFCRNRRALGLGPATGDLAGAQAEFVRVPRADLNLKTLSGALSGLSDEEALFAGDILATGFYAASLSEVGDGSHVVVIGAGPVGLFCAAAVRRAGAGEVYVLDLDPSRVAFARDRLGLNALEIGPDTDVGAEINALTGGRMADIAIEAVGAVPAMKSALRCVRDGGRVTVVGVYAQERYELPMGVAWNRGLDIRFAGMANVHANWDDALLAVAKGELDPTRLITHRLPLEQAEEGYELFRTKQAMKVALTP